MADVTGEGLAGLLAALESEADEQIARYDAEVRREVDAILAVAHAEAAALERRPLEEQQAELAREVARVEAAARLDAERVVRETRDRCFVRGLDALRERLEDVRGRPGYAALLASLADEASAALPDARTMRVDPRDLDAVRVSAMTIEATLETAGGVVLEDGEGRAVVNTLEERIANAEPMLREALARIAVEAEAGIEADTGGGRPG